MFNNVTVTMYIKKEDICEENNSQSSKFEENYKFIYPPINSQLQEFSMNLN